MLPPLLRTFFAKRKPPAMTATQKAAHLRGVPFETLEAGQCTTPLRNRWGTQTDEWLRQELRKAGDKTPDQIARDGQGETQ